MIFEHDWYFQDQEVPHPALQSTLACLPIQLWQIALLREWFLEWVIWWIMEPHIKLVSVYCEKTDKSNLNTKVIILVCKSRTTFHHGRKCMMAEARGIWPHCSHSHKYLGKAYFLYSFQDSSNGVVLSSNFLYVEHFISNWHALRIRRPY